MLMSTIGQLPSSDLFLGLTGTCGRLQSTLSGRGKVVGIKSEVAEDRGFYLIW